MKPILHPRGAIGRTEQTCLVGLVLGEEETRRLAPHAIAGEQGSPQGLMLGSQSSDVGAIDPALRPVALPVPSPGPCVAHPQRRQDVQRRGLRPPIRARDPDQNVVRAGFRIFDEDIEVPTLHEHIRIFDLELGIALPTPRVLGHQLLVWKRTLGILVECLQIRRRRRGIQIVVHLFDVLAVIAFRTR